MYVRTVVRKNSGNIAVQIVASYRNKDNAPRQRIICYMGTAPKGPALDELLRLAEIEKAKLNAEHQRSIFPIETLAELAIKARELRQQDRPLPIADARKLHEQQRMSLGFHEVFGSLYEQLGLDEVWSRQQRVSGKVFCQAVLMRLAAPGLSPHFSYIS